MKLLEDFQRPARRLVPTEEFGALQAMAAQLFQKALVAESAGKAPGDVIDRVGVEHGVGAPDDLRQACGIGRDHGGAAAHGFQRRQPEAFPERREDEQPAETVERHEVVVGNEPVTTYSFSRKPALRAMFFTRI